MEPISHAEFSQCLRQLHLQHYIHCGTISVSHRSFGSALDNSIFNITFIWNRHLFVTQEFSHCPRHCGTHFSFTEELSQCLRQFRLQHYIHLEPQSLSHRQPSSTLHSLWNRLSVTQELSQCPRQVQFQHFIHCYSESLWNHLSVTQEFSHCLRQVSLTSTLLSLWNHLSFTQEFSQCPRQV